MKKSFVALSAAAALTWLVGCQPKQATWQLVWEENFDQTEHFDEATWSKIPRGTSPWNKYMSDFDSCYAMENWM